MCYMVKKGSIEIFDVEMRRPEVGTGCCEFFVYFGLPSSFKHNLNFVLGLTCYKCKSMTFGVVLSVLELDILPMIPTAAFSINCILCKSALDEPYKKGLQKLF